MLKVLVIEKEPESKIEEELKKISHNTEVIIASTFKEGMKYILKYGSSINLTLLNDNISDIKDSTVVDMLEINNIKTIIICDNIKELPTELVFSKECIIDCIMKYDDKSTKNIVNSAHRILKNLDKKNQDKNTNNPAYKRTDKTILQSFC